VAAGARLLLDALPGAVGAWASRQLSSAYAGALYDEAGGAISLLYDQSGASNHAPQVAGREPLLSGDVLRLDGVGHIALPDLSTVSLYCLIACDAGDEAGALFGALGRWHYAGVYHRTNTTNNDIVTSGTRHGGIYIDAQPAPSTRLGLGAALLGHARVVSWDSLGTSVYDRGIGATNGAGYELEADVMAIVAYPAGLYTHAQVSAEMRKLAP
jgi:hypothetical protein